MKQIQYILCVSMCVVSSIDLWGMDAGPTGPKGPTGAGAGAFSLSSMPAEESAQSKEMFFHYAYQKLKKYQHCINFFDAQQAEDYLSDLIEVKKSYERYIDLRCQACCRKAPFLQKFVQEVKKEITDALGDYIMCVTKIREPRMGFNVKTMLEPTEDSLERMRHVFPPVLVHKVPSDDGYATYYVAKGWPLPESYLNCLEALPHSIWSMQKRLSPLEERLADLENQAKEISRGALASVMAVETAKEGLRFARAEQIAADELRHQQELADVDIIGRLERAKLEPQKELKDHEQHAITKRELAVQKDRDAAHAERHGKIIAAGKWMLIAAALSTIGGMVAYFGFRNFFKERPKIIGPNDTSIGSGLKKAKYPAANLDRLILTPELEKMVLHKFKGIELAIQKMLPLSNMMFFGPAGTGKTMAAQEFVRHLSGKRLVDHIIVRGPAFKQFNKTSEAISALKSVIRFAEASYKKRRKPVVIVFDEAETLFADRAQPEFATEITRDLVTVMTSEISAAVNKHIMFILSTNFPDRIDKALLNRIDESNRIRFLAPGQAERESLLRLYLDEALTQQGFTVSDEVMNAIPQFAKSIDGMVGRQISSMVTQSIYRLLNEGEIDLTLPLFKETIAATMAQKDYAAY